MNAERWRVLSEWHNTWLAAPTDQRAGLRATFATEHADLLQIADELAASSGAVDGFLETPALVLAALDLAQDEPPLPEGTSVGLTVSSALWLVAELETCTATDSRPVEGRAHDVVTQRAIGTRRRFLQERESPHRSTTRTSSTFDVGCRSDPLLSRLLEARPYESIAGGLSPPGDALAACPLDRLAAAHALGYHRDLKPRTF